MADFAPFLLSPQMMQKIETAQHNYASEMLESVKAQHAQVACGVCVCAVFPPSLSVIYYKIYYIMCVCSLSSLSLYNI